MPPTQEGAKRRLRDTRKATQSRVSKIGSHKLGFGLYNSIHGGMVSDIYISYIFYFKQSNHGHIDLIVYY